MDGADADLIDVAGRQCPSDGFAEKCGHGPTENRSISTQEVEALLGRINTAESRGDALPESLERRAQRLMQGDRIGCGDAVLDEIGDQEESRLTAHDPTGS